ncbi:MAG: RDD family protein [Bdellovibrionales bacterium]|nr:RDD family protein [Bdellovibrionales bacterium]NQZ20392.1 RDD family protein [Bdellovibrionales bacterium]
MVENRDFPFSNGLTSDGVIGLASPKDRLASYVVDALLLLPLVQLLQAPFKRWILESFIFGESEGVIWFRLINMAIFILAFVVYYTVMTYFGGQTLGKKFFGVKVISYQGKITLVTAFLRSFSIFLEMVCVAIPFFAIFSI